MEKCVLLLAFIANFFNYYLASSKTNWSIPKGKIKHVFECVKTDKKIELLRLYSEGEYEQIEYLFQKNKSEIVHRNLGTYTISKAKLILNKPSFKEFNAKVPKGEYFFKNNIYKKAINAFLLKKNTLALKTTKKEFKKPFFIGINSDEIVSNNSIINGGFTLEQLVNYLTQGLKDDRAKVMAISKFICRSIEYDHDGYLHGNYAHRQDDVFAILSSNQRIAVCAGYAFVFDSLARMAKIQTREVTGYTKQGYGDYNKLGGLHAWNIVTLEGKEYYIDVTWSDQKKDINMTWMFTDPEILLGTHYPEEEEDNLFKKSFTTEDFKHREVVIARKEFAKIKHYPTASWVRVEGDHYTLKFKSKVDVEANWLDPEIARFVYRNEKSCQTKWFEYNQIEKIKTYFSKDTFCVEIPITQNELALNINVENEYEIRLHIFKGNEIEYCKQLMAKWNKDHVIAFTEGILAAIKIGDTKFLKDNLGDKYNLLYDNKNRWKLNKSLLANIKEWDGTAEQLDGVDRFIHRGDETTVVEERFVKYNSTDKVYVKFTNNQYEFLCIK